jgi:diguanylate cyclase (GGDEF)-like protein
MLSLPSVLNRSLSTRIVLAALALLIGLQLVTFAALRVIVEGLADRAIEADLTVGRNVFQRLITQNAERLQLATSVLAADFGFRDAVTSNDLPTISSALENSANRIGASVAVLLSPERKFVAAADVPDATTVQVIERLATDIATREGPVKLGLLNGRPYQFVLTDVRAPTVVGRVLMGFAVAESLAPEIQRLSGVHAALVWRDLTGSMQQVTTLPTADPNALAGLPLVGTNKVRIAGADPYRAAAIELASAGGTLRVVLLRSVRDATESLRMLGLELAIISALGAAILALGIALATRRVTRPLAELTTVTRALEQGDFAVNVDHTERADEVGKLARGFASMRDSLDRQRSEITRLAYWDALTQIPNRLQFLQRLRAAMEPGAMRSPLAVLALNLDRFKTINDVLGHGLGDEVIQAVAARLSTQVARREDLVARMAGDEFAIMLIHADTAAASQVAERISHAFATPLAIAGQTIDLSASIGYSVWNGERAEHTTQELSEALIIQAELAMRMAKSRGIGVAQYSPDFDSRSAESLTLLGELRQAIAGDELRLFLQPKIRTSDRALVAVEALVRWQHPQRGLVPPIAFIPFAEKTGFIRELTLWVFDAAARAIPALVARTPGIRVAVNLSTRDLLDADLPAKLTSVMERRGASAQAFILEITESAIMDDPQRSLATLRRLDDMGFRLSIDDFGTGYSSLAYLKTLPVKELKIDKSFVMAMDSEENDRQIVRTIIELAHNLSLSVVAEGVENAKTLELLMAMGCEQAQGYHISRPLPVDRFAAWQPESA